MISQKETKKNKKGLKIHSFVKGKDGMIRFL